MDLINLVKSKNLKYPLIGIAFVVMSQLIIMYDPLSYESKRMAIYLFTILPGAVIIISSFFLSRDKKIFKFISFLCIGIFMLGILRGCIGLGWETSGPFSDIKYYEYILRENGYPKSKVLNHFPKSIPSSAINVKMCYGRGFLQASTSLILRMGLSYKEFNDVLLKYKIDESSLPKEKKDVNRKEFGSGKLQSQIADYSDIFIFDKHIDVFPDDFYFRELDSNSIIAVSLPRKEVLYWYNGGQ